jgi:hypothetical protein
MLGCQWMRWLGGIYSPQPLPSRWQSLLAMDTPDSPVAHRTVTVHCPVRATSVRLLGFGAVDRWNPLYFCCTGQSGDIWLLCSDFCEALFATVDFVVNRWRAGSRCSAGSLDSPVNYSGARPRNSREWHVRLLAGLVHRTVSGAHRTLFGAPFSAHSQDLLQINLSPQYGFFLGLCWTLCTWDTWHLDKLVSPRDLCWTSTTKIDYRKWLSPFPFHQFLTLCRGCTLYPRAVIPFLTKERYSPLTTT